MLCFERYVTSAYKQARNIWQGEKRSAECVNGWSTQRTESVFCYLSLSLPLPWLPRQAIWNMVLLETRMHVTSQTRWPGPSIFLIVMDNKVDDNLRKYLRETHNLISLNEALRMNVFITSPHTHTLNHPSNKQPKCNSTPYQSCIIPSITCNFTAIIFFYKTLMPSLIYIYIYIYSKEIQ